MLAKKSLFVSDKPVGYIESNYLFDAVVLVWRTQPHHTQECCRCLLAASLLRGLHIQTQSLSFALFAFLWKHFWLYFCSAI